MPPKPFDPAAPQYQQRDQRLTVNSSEQALFLIMLKDVGVNVRVSADHLREVYQERMIYHVGTERRRAFAPFNGLDYDALNPTYHVMVKTLDYLHTHIYRSTLELVRHGADRSKFRVPWRDFLLQYDDKGKFLTHGEHKGCRNAWTFALAHLPVRLTANSDLTFGGGGKMIVLIGLDGKDVLFDPQTVPLFYRATAPGAGINPAGCTISYVPESPLGGPPSFHAGGSTETEQMSCAASNNDSEHAHGGEEEETETERAEEIEKERAEKMEKEREQLEKEKERAQLLEEVRAQLIEKERAQLENERAKAMEKELARVRKEREQLEKEKERALWKKEREQLEKERQLEKEKREQLEKERQLEKEKREQLEKEREREKEEREQLEMVRQQEKKEREQLEMVRQQEKKELEREKEERQQEKKELEREKEEREQLEKEREREKEEREQLEKEREQLEKEREREKEEREQLEMELTHLKEVRAQEMEEQARAQEQKKREQLEEELARLKRARAQEVEEKERVEMMEERDQLKKQLARARKERERLENEPARRKEKKRAAASDHDRVLVGEQAHPQTLEAGMLDSTSIIDDLKLWQPIIERDQSLDTFDRDLLNAQMEALYDERDELEAEDRWFQTDDRHQDLQMGSAEDLFERWQQVRNLIEANSEAVRAVQAKMGRCA